MKSWTTRSCVFDLLASGYPNETYYFLQSFKLLDVNLNLRALPLCDFNRKVLWFLNIDFMTGSKPPFSTYYVWLVTVLSGHTPWPNEMWHHSHYTSPALYSSVPALAWGCYWAWFTHRQSTKDEITEIDYFTKKIVNTLGQKKQAVEEHPFINQWNHCISL